MARGVTISLLFLCVCLFWCLCLHARGERERENEREYIFPANNLPTTATKYICYRVHPRKHHPLLLRSNSYVHPESQNQADPVRPLHTYQMEYNCKELGRQRGNDASKYISYYTAKASIIIDHRNRNEVVILRP